MAHKLLACLLFLLFLSSCESERKQETLFRLLFPSTTGIDFENNLKENEEFNIIEYLYFYNGGGVSVGDINNDGLTDLYFTSNQNSNKLYLNKGNFQFEDITEKAGVKSLGNWKTGVTMADVNADGLLDIYVCGVGNYKGFQTTNQLFINNGDLTFSEKAKEYNLDFSGLSTQASFFDYDLDGDLDMFLLNHSVHSVRSYERISARYDYDPLASDKLYRNELDKGISSFVDASDVAGIIGGSIGYGLGVSTADINMDGYPDIYVSNDFRENDYLYINQHDGTFKQEIEKRLGHSSRFSMGNDVADLNNDGQPDILTVDMMPRDESIIKASVGEDSYEIYKYKLDYGYYHQVARNSLQLNRGDGCFSDIAWLAGVADTDWSWAPLMADFDNDGLKDIFISNGIVKRPNDLTYLNFISSDSAQKLSDHQLASNMPDGQATNFIFKNENGMVFQDMSKQWGLDRKSYSNGAAYCDLDNDGDLDLVVNNINEKAFIYENTLKDSTGNYLQFSLKGSKLNPFSIGAKIFVFANGKKFYQELTPTRGFQSSIDYKITMGFGKVSLIDSMFIVWPDDKLEKRYSVKPNQFISLDYTNAKLSFEYDSFIQKPEFLQEVELKTDIPFIHKENKFVDFNREGLMPRMVSTDGPKMAVGDVNNDGLDDFFIGGSRGQPSALFIQNAKREFVSSNKTLFVSDSVSEVLGSTFFDIDGDGDLDLITAFGGNEFREGDQVQPKLYSNNGRGIFSKSVNSFPEIYVNASCVKSGDYDQDGDLDLFIGGRIIPGEYGINPQSFILSNNGKGVFKDVSANTLVSLQNIGMVTDASWIDLNKDGLLDLIVVGEWMPITILIQTKRNVFENRTIEWNLSNSSGWWNALTVADFDSDGDMDFIAGNQGLNSRLSTSEQCPVEMWVDDFDKNGSIEQIMTYFNQGISYPLVSRDQLVKQIPPFKKKYLKYENYIQITRETILSDLQRKGAIYKKATTFHSSYFENKGSYFERTDLGVEAQTFPIMAIQADDVNDDGHLDILVVGNLYATQPDLGRYDAGSGLLLLGDGQGKFEPVNPVVSGFTVTGEGRDIKLLDGLKKQKIYLSSRNNQELVSFKLIK